MTGDRFDEAVFETSVARKPVLRALAEEPHHRRDLQDELDLSKTTCHRIVRTFDDHGLLRRTDSGYELSTLGDLVAEAVDSFDATVRAGYRLEPLVGPSNRPRWTSPSNCSPTRT